MKKLLGIVLLSLCALIIAACGDDTKSNVTESTALISADEGGTISTGDGSSIVIPHGALAEDTEITMTVLETKDLIGDKEIVASKVLRFGPRGLIFLKPVLITTMMAKDVENQIISAAVLDPASNEWRYDRSGTAVVVTKDALGDPVMSTAMGDPVMLNAMGDPVMMSASGESSMLTSAGEPIMISAMGDPIMGAAMGDPIMMTTGHFSVYAFVAVPVEEPADSDIEPDEEPDTEPDTEEPDTEEPDTEEPDVEEPDTEEPDTEKPDTEEPDADEDTVLPDEDEEPADEDLIESECTLGEKRCYESALQECVDGFWNEGSTCQNGCYPETKECNVYAVGELVTFGRYEQDNDPGNGSEPIEWRVLEVNGSTVFVVSEKGLDAFYFHNESVDTNWGESWIRNWLNGSFLTTSFTSEEAEKIVVSSIRAEVNSTYPDVDPGTDTEDKIFLLSAPETMNTAYFPDSASKIAYPTEYAKGKGAHINEATGAGLWWLRSMGSTNKKATMMNFDGASIAQDSVDALDVMVRPAMRFNAAD